MARAGELARAAELAITAEVSRAVRAQAGPHAVEDIAVALLLAEGLLGSGATTEALIAAG